MSGLTPRPPLRVCLRAFPLTFRLLLRLCFQGRGALRRFDTRLFLFVPIKCPLLLDELTVPLTQWAPSSSRSRGTVISAITRKYRVDVGRWGKRQNPGLG